MAANLDLVVEPAKELEDSVGPPADAVPGEVKPASRFAKRVGNEPLGRQAGGGRGIRAASCTPPTYRSPATPTGNG